MRDQLHDALVASLQQYAAFWLRYEVASNPVRAEAGAWAAGGGR
jgi:hypothetical protein